MLGLREEPLPCTELPTRVMSRWPGCSSRLEGTLLYRNGAAIISSVLLLLNFILYYYRMIRGRPVLIRLWRKRQKKGKKSFSLFYKNIQNVEKFSITREKVQQTEDNS